MESFHRRLELLGKMAGHEIKIANNSKGRSMGRTIIELHNVVELKATCKSDRGAELQQSQITRLCYS